ncbi:MAG TPA: histidine kinase N-terminal 7TM domain-containing protein [Anaerolineales bacterium]|nr:histidine kinase N-terminal 7TM domain-containing protein [Anaerolineales bacterium]HMX18041.1 histidine kinase N-terminal 7TM domain-containing protein [Anaerolineales bacterium]HNC88062.1 histidine kinase N-terminal 7TM domain-containing protein [Anaerolineales bacterium]HNF33600.1 histidine kinase N-terminal 7TM domain-containing protein [Anaerolineales bacterium]HNH03725.1 histidine kinase N-terminal 7TM domain-containing protein [Anaerolineales bacterium]
MTRSEIPHLIPYLVSLAVSIAVFVYTWSRRKARGAFAFSFYGLGQSLWLTGFICELTSSDISTKIFWDSFQWFAGFFILISLPIFLVQYTEYKLNYPRLLFGLSFIVPILFSSVLFLDQNLHWVYRNPHLSTQGFFTELLYDFTPLVYGYAFYALLILAWGLRILFQRITHSHSLYQTQMIMISLGLLIPILGMALTLFDIRITPQRDMAPFTFVIGNLFVVWGLFQFRMFNVTPIARDTVFEAMVEPVVILNNQNDIVDINLSMLALLGKTADDVIGEPAKKIFADFPIPIKQYMQTSYARAEATFDLGGVHVYYELTVWPLYNSNKEMTGRIYISHDITAQKELERELRKLNAELEDRVRARTWELADAYDTTLEGWARALELRDKETEGHSRRVTDMTLKIAVAMGVAGDDLEHMRRGAILHDIGKMAVPDEILHKPDKLTDNEREIIKKHPEIATKLLSPIPFLKKALDIPYSHHEKWDGSGYPQGLKGEEIPIAARIFAVADVWDAVTSDRPYNKAWPREQALKYFGEQTGKHFDPRVVNIFLKLVEQGEI